jgi:hypothetical protein
MARNKKCTVDYFPHDTKHGKTMFIIENRYGNDGYSAWFKTLEILGSTEGHYIDCNNIETWEFLLAKTRISADILTSIYDTLSNLGAIDNQLWSKKVIWSDNFILRISDAYSRRMHKLPDKNSLLGIYVNRNGINVCRNDINDNISTEIEKEIESKKKVNKSKEYNAEIISLASLLAELILRNNPNSIQLTEDKKPQTVIRWCKDIEMLHRVDKQDILKIEQVIRWCQNDNFWKSNILSAAKLREKWDKLTVKMIGGNNGSPKPAFEQKGSYQKESGKYSGIGQVFDIDREN